MAGATFVSVTGVRVDGTDRIEGLDSIASKGGGSGGGGVDGGYDWLGAEKLVWTGHWARICCSSC